MLPVGTKSPSLRFLPHGDVAVDPQIPAVAERFKAQADLREEIARFGARAVRPDAEARNPFRFHREWRPGQPAEADAEVVADAVHVVERHLAIEKRDRVFEVLDAHRADVEVAAAILSVAFRVVAQAEQRAELLREEFAAAHFHAGRARFE